MILVTTTVLLLSWMAIPWPTLHTCSTHRNSGNRPTRQQAVNASLQAIGRQQQAPSISTVDPGRQDEDHRDRRGVCQWQRCRLSSMTGQCVTVTELPGRQARGTKQRSPRGSSCPANLQLLRPHTIPRAARMQSKQCQPDVESKVP